MPLLTKIRLKGHAAFSVTRNSLHCGMSLYSSHGLVMDIAPLPQVSIWGISYILWTNETKQKGLLVVKSAAKSEIERLKSIYYLLILKLILYFIEKLRVNMVKIFF